MRDTIYEARMRISSEEWDWHPFSESTLWRAHWTDSKQQNATKDGLELGGIHVIIMHDSSTCKG